MISRNRRLKRSTQSTDYACLKTFETLKELLCHGTIDNPTDVDGKG